MAQYLEAIEPRETSASEAGRLVRAVPAATRRLLTAWLGLALGSLVAAGIFAILVAFARAPAVQLLGSSASLFHLALVAHVTFALTIWFVAFAGVLWVYAAWRSNYDLPGASALYQKLMGFLAAQ